MRRSPRVAVDQAYFSEMSIPEPNSGCWLWLGTLGNKGYGIVAIGGGKKTSAHRASFIVHTNQKLRSDLDVDHVCRNPHCVNPEHLDAVTHQENCRRRNLQITTCTSGHPLDGVKRYRSGRQVRYCRECDRQRIAKRRAAMCNNYDTALTRIRELEGAFAALGDDPATPAWIKTFARALSSKDQEKTNG